MNGRIHFLLCSGDIRLLPVGILVSGLHLDTLDTLDITDVHVPTFRVE